MRKSAPNTQQPNTQQSDTQQSATNAYACNQYTPSAGRRFRWHRTLVMAATLLVLMFAAATQHVATVNAADVTEREVLDSIERAKRFLIQAQEGDGGWSWAGNAQHRIGVTALATLAMLSAGSSPDSAEMKAALTFLRNQEVPTETYDSALMLMALAAAKAGPRDRPRIAAIVQLLERGQIRNQVAGGMWDYNPNGGDNALGDRSNSQFAVLALKEAQDSGVPVSQETLAWTRRDWVGRQLPDGGWAYRVGNNASTGTMTVAGIASLVITETMLHDPDEDLNPDGTPNCCNDGVRDKSLERGLKWLGDRFSVRHAPSSGQGHLLYYMYGLERAGRLSGRRFFGEGNNRHDWYREGAEFLVSKQHELRGSWVGEGLGESDPVIATSLSLLFLSKGLAPVLVTKLETSGGADWNVHPNEIRNLTHHITTLNRWPRLLNWQVMNLQDATAAELQLSPISYITGRNRFRLNQAEVETLREYISNGGFVFAVAGCNSADFDAGLRQLVRDLYPGGEGQLRRLPPEHAVYRAEYPLDPATVELWGVEVGCRTSLIYSPNDIGCLWDKWTPFALPGRKPETSAMITKAMQIGVNVAAYAAGREPLSSLAAQQQVVQKTGDDKTAIARGFLEVAKIRHSGGWDAAPLALRNLLSALNTTIGKGVNTTPRDLTLVDPDIYRYPMLYMHGRYAFSLSEPEADRLRDYLANGGVLFADSCCSSPQFDKSFRAAMAQVLPDKPLERVPVDHLLFSQELGFDLKRVRRRDVIGDGAAAGGGGGIESAVQAVEPYLEGIAVEGRYVVIYSKYDISCALEQQAAVSCPGYVHEDAVKIAVNAVLYALQQ